VVNDCIDVNDLRRDGNFLDVLGFRRRQVRRKWLLLVAGFFGGSLVLLLVAAWWLSVTVTNPGSRLIQPITAKGQWQKADMND
jgi:hypothetical protein